MSKKESHPVQIGFQYNERMNAYDLMVFVGNFKTQEDADAYAKRIMEHLAEEAGGRFQPVQ